MSELTAGIDLGGTKIQTVVVADEAVVGSARVPTPHSGTPDVVAAMVDTVKGAIGAAGAPAGDLEAVGIGAPGAIDREAGVVEHSPNIPGFQEPVKLGPLVSESLGRVTVLLDNDVRVAIRGEHARGAGRPYRNILGVFVGTGVGGGLILDGEIREGGGAAGEIGHTLVKDNGRMCSDHRRGHLEAYAGRGQMEAYAKHQVKRGKHTDLFKIMEHKGKDRLTSAVFAHALEEGDHFTVKLIDEAVWALSIALSNAQNLLDLEAIVVGGGLGDRLGEPFVRRIEEAMAPRLFVPDRPPKMLTTELGDLGGAVGAAVLAGG